MAMARLAYVGVLIFVVFGTLWLEIVLRTRVYARWRRLLASLVPGLVIFIAWDIYAIASVHWWFDTDRITGIYVFAGLPLDELLFFLVIPVAAVLTLEAVRSVRRWPVGDEPPGAVEAGRRVDDS